jgi:hypothetical protein
MTRRFRQMQPEERVTLAALRLQGIGLRVIAEVLGRNACSLSRELRRNADSEGACLAAPAFPPALAAGGKGASRPLPSGLTAEKRWLTTTWRAFYGPRLHQGQALQVACGQP